MRNRFRPSAVEIRAIQSSPGDFDPSGIWDSPGEPRVYRGDFAIRAEANGGPSCLQCHYCNLFGQPAARRAERAAHHFWRLPKGPQEGPAHTLSIREPGLARDRIDGMPTLFEHQPRGIEATMFRRLGGRLAGFRPERAA